MTSSQPTEIRPRFVKHESGTVYFEHRCCICGSDNAPFGVNVNLSLAMRLKDPSHAGRWYCVEHKPEK